MNIEEQIEIGRMLGGKVTNDHPVGFESEAAESSVTRKWFFDVQWSDCPTEVEDEVRKQWRNRELGNDNYVYRVEMDEELLEDSPKVFAWLAFKGVPLGEEVIVHWWW